MQNNAISFLGFFSENFFSIFKPEVKVLNSALTPPANTGTLPGTYPDFLNWNQFSGV